MKKTLHFSNKRLLLVFLLIGSISVFTLSNLYSQTPSIITVSVGNEPRGGAFNPYTGTGVVTNHNSNTVSVFNVTTFSVTNVTVGSHPYGVAINTATNKAYVANEQSDTVSVIDLNTNTVTATISVGGNPRGIAVNSTTNQAIVANSKTDTISILNLSTNTVSATLSVGTDPEGVVINPATNLAYVTNYGSDSVSVVNLTTQVVAATLSVGSGPIGIDINPNTKRIVVVNRLSNTVSIIDGYTNTMVSTVAVGTGPSGVAIHPVNNVAYITNEYSDSVSVINLVTNTVTATWPVGKNPEGVAVLPQYNLLFVVNAKGDQGYVINLNNPPTGTPVAVGQDPEGVAIDPDTNTAITANSKSNTLSVVDLGSATQIATIPVGQGPQDVALHPVSKRLVSANYRENTATIIDYSTRTVLATVAVGKRPGSVAIDPVLNIAVVANEKDGTLSLIDLSTNTVSATLPAGSHPVDIDINPQTHIAVVANKKIDSVTLIDLANKLTLATLSVGKDPNSVAINPNTNTAVVANQKSATLSVIDLGSKTVTATISTLPYPTGIAINPSTNIAAVTSHETNSLQLIDLNTNLVLTTLYPVGIEPEDAAINPYTNVAAITNESALGLTILQLPNPVPVLTSLSPVTVTAGDPGFTLTLNGSKFLKTSTVTFNTQSVFTQFVNNGQLTASIPASAITTAGSVTIAVTNPSPGGGTSNPLSLTINNPVPVLNTLSPTSVIPGSGSFQLTLTGSKFLTNSTVYFNGIGLTPVFVNSTTLTATVPASAVAFAGNNPVTVFNPAPGGGSSSSLTFTVNNPVPTLTALSPNNIIAGSNSFLLTLSGANFVTTSTVNFSGQIFTPQFVSTTQLNVTVPASAIVNAGLAPVSVANPAPGGGASTSLTFTINNPMPALSTLSPNNILAGSSSFLLTVSGANFVTTSTVNFSGQALIPQFVSSSQLNVTIPASAVTSAGIFTVTVGNPAPGGGTSNGTSFTVNNPIPILTTLSPATVIPGTGDFLLTLTGSNFVSTTAVLFDNQTLAPGFISSTQINVTIPGARITTAHTATVTVFNPAPGGGISNLLNLIVNTPPVANAGNNLSALVGKPITLDGRKSYDADPGDKITFSWSLISTPMGSTTSLMNTTSVRPSLTPDVAGSYQVQLIVNDGNANSNPATVTITPTTGNAAPNADPGSDQTALVGQTVTFDGRKSSDPDNDKITYKWSMVSAPAGSTAALTGANTVQPALKPDLAGIYLVQLIANDGIADGLPVQVKLTAASASAAPMAKAGKDKNALTGSSITLDGTGSRDPNGNPLSYKWSLVSMPQGSTTSFGNGTSATPTLTPDKNGEYLVRLMVNNGTSDSAPDTILIVANAPNSAPNAVVGADQLIYQTDTVTLDGTGSFDPDGDPITYSWLMVSTPAGSQAAFATTTVVKPTFVADVNGAYVARLTVSDGVNSSFADVVVVKTTALTSISILPVNPTITLGQTQAFSATGTFADSTTKNLTGMVTWASSVTTVATINSSGTATGVKAGTTQITAAYGSIVSPAQTLSVNNPVPVLSTLTPNSAVAGTGSFTLNLTGSGFVSGATVNFGAISLVATVTDSVHLSASVPALAMASPGTVSVLVINPAPGGGTSNAILFNIIGPVINSISPVSGPIGTVLTISGQNFDPTPSNNKVKVNNTSAVVTSSTATQIKTLIPEGATTGPVFVTTPQGVATSPVAFAVTLSTDFTISGNPAQVKAVQGSRATFVVSSASIGTNPYTGQIALSVNGLPTGAYSLLSANQIFAGGQVTTTVYTPTTLAAGTYPFTVSGAAQIDGQTVTHQANLTLQTLAPGSTTLSGRVLSSGDDTPLQGVTVTLGASVSYTDAAGNFLLQNIPIGAQMVAIDGKTANKPGAFYPGVDIAVNVQANVANDVGYIVYLPKLDIMHPVNLPVDSTGTTTQTVNATTPLIPDLTVTIPSGTKIIDPNGNPVSQITISPVPADRSPMPLPAGTEISQLFTIQPGGSVPSKLVPISFPNTNHADPGVRATLYYFDVVSGTWKSYGQGTVSADGKQIVPDAGVGIPRFAWHFAQVVVLPPPQPNSCDNPTCVKDPVDMSTGIFRLNHTDLAIDGKTPVALVRHYRTNTTDAGPFGPGTGMDYDYRLAFFTSTSMINLIYPDGERSGFTNTGPGIYTNSQRPSQRAAVLTQVNSSTYSLKEPDGTVMTFTISGFSGYVTSIIDTNGNTMMLTRDGSNRITTLTSDTGQTITLTYDANGHITQAVDTVARTVKYSYDTSGNLISYTDAGGNITQYQYNPANSPAVLVLGVVTNPDVPYRMTKIIDARGNAQVENFYGQDGRITKQVQADGGVIQYFWFGAKSPVYLFPTSCPGNLIPIIVPPGQAQPGVRCVIFTPSPPVPTDRLVSQSIMIDPLGNSATYRFNADGYLTQRVDPLGEIAINSYSIGTNLLMAATDALGRTTRYSYDNNANMTSITDPNGNVTTLTYEPAFNKTTSITDTLGNKTQFGYDPKGNLTSITDPMNNTTVITYNTAGQPLTVTDPLGNTTTFSYDGQGNLNATKDPVGNMTQRYYDPISRLVQLTDPKGKNTGFTYDNLSRITQIIDPQLNKTQFAYDGNANLTSVTDANNHVLNYAYDVRNRAASKTDPLLRQENYQYDQNDNLIKYTDRKNQTTTLAYDPLNRKISTTFADGSSVTNLFDPAGRLTQITDTQTGSLMYSYDNLDRLTQEQTNQGTVGYQYDPIGRRTNMSVNGQTPVSYGYDADSRLTTIMALTGTFNLTYDPAGRRKALAYPNGVTTSYSYDNNSRIFGINHATPTNTIENITYGYDQNGLRTAMSRLNSATAFPAAITAAYDAANELTNYNNPTPNLTYDANGNLTSDGTKTYSWNSRNQLVGISGGGVTASFVYDAVGRRISKTVNGVRTDFQYDGNDIVSEIGGGSAVNATYIRTQNIDEPLARITSTGVEYYHADALGSIFALTDAYGNSTTSYTYDPFGNTTQTGISTNPFQYTGRENDGTGLYYYRARYYSPTLQRFISEDPIGLRGGINKYAYSLNDPINKIDPLGLFSLEDVSNFSAGFGDTITFGATEWIRDRLSQSLFGDTNTVNKCSSSYTAGEVTGYTWDVLTAGLGVARAAGWTTKLAIHEAHHAFGDFGELAHIQLNYWRIGVKGSGGAFRIPLPWR